MISTEIVDIMKAAGLETPDISILSDQFLAEVRETDKKNLGKRAKIKPSASLFRAITCAGSLVFCRRPEKPGIKPVVTLRLG